MQLVGGPQNVREAFFVEIVTGQPRRVVPKIRVPHFGTPKD